MSSFDKLKQMDIEEVHRKTRITLVRLQDILEKRFDNINPTLAHGFIKILERELQLDLGEWIQEYDSYRKPQVQNDSSNQASEINSEKISPTKEVEIETKHTRDTAITQTISKPKKQPNTIKQQLKNMNIEINIPKQQLSYKTILVVMVLFFAILLIVVGIYLIDSTNSQEKQAVEQNNTQKKVVEKDISQTYPTISLYEALNDKENDRELDKTEQQTTQQNQTQKLDSIRSKDTHENSTESTQNKTGQTTLTITPKQDVWFAWVDTQTKARGEKYTKTPVTLTIKNKTAFHFGYAVLSIEADGQTFDYNQKGVTYMLYDRSQGMKLITQKEYRALGGK